MSNLYETLSVSELARLIARLQGLKDHKSQVARNSEPKPVHGSTDPLVITFTKEYNGATPYQHAAVRVPSTGLWSVTGRADLTGVSWEKVHEYIERNERHPERAVRSITPMVSVEYMNSAVDAASASSSDPYGY